MASILSLKKHFSGPKIY